MTSNWLGFPTSCMHVLSTIISCAWIMGYSFATSRNSCSAPGKHCELIQSSPSKRACTWPFRCIAACMASSAPYQPKQQGTSEGQTLWDLVEVPDIQGVRAFRNSPSLSFMMLALWMAVTLRRLFRYANPNAYSTVRRDFSCVITCAARACQHKGLGFKGLPLVLGKRSTLHEAWMVMLCG